MPSTNIFTHDNYRKILEAEFNERKLRRKSYTLNAFARDLGISSARMSSVLRGRYGLSTETASAIAAKMNLSKNEAKYFVTLVTSEHARTNAERAHAKEMLKKFQCRFEVKSADADYSQLYKKWYFSAAQMLVMIHKDKITSNSLVSALRISKAQADETLKLLETLGFIRKVREGYLRRNVVVSSESPMPSEVIRSFHKQILDEAKASVDRLPIEKRKLRSTVFIFDSAKMKEARDWVENAHEEFINKFGATDASDCVAAVSMQFFRIDEEKIHD